MKILHVLDHSIPLHSGYTFRTRAILEQQRRFNWETAHVTSTKHIGAAVDEEVVDDLHFYRTTPAGGWLSGLPVLNQYQVIATLARRIDQVIDREQPDILHAHSPSLNGLAALRAARNHGIPVVYECRAFWEDAAVDHGTSSEGGARYRLTRALETRVFRQADAVTTICEGLKRDIAARGIPQEKITVIPNAVDIDRFTLSEIKHPKLLADIGLVGKTVLGFLGSFYAYEGLALLIRALPAILRQAPDVRLLLVGGGPQEENLRKLTAELHLDEAIRFVGRVPHDRVADYYSLVDILVYPRLNMRLTDLVTPLKPLEAMAQGKLVLASDVGGHRVLIRDGGNGVLFRADSSEELAQAAVATLADRANWPTLKANGRAFVDRERNWKASVGRYREVYGRLV